MVSLPCLNGTNPNEGWILFAQQDSNSFINSYMQDKKQAFEKLDDEVKEDFNEFQLTNYDIVKE